MGRHCRRRRRLRQLRGCVQGAAVGAAAKVGRVAAAPAAAAAAAAGLIVPPALPDIVGMPGESVAAAVARWCRRESGCSTFQRTGDGERDGVSGCGWVWGDMMVASGAVGGDEL